MNEHHENEANRGLDRALANFPALWQGPPRNPARIDRVLAALRAAWTLAPDLRLGQLLMAALPDDSHAPHAHHPNENREQDGRAAALFYLEDDGWERVLASLGAELASSGRAASDDRGSNG
jgi:hypothetical protein